MDATNIKNETGNSSPTSCSKVKQLETSSKKWPCFYLKKYMFTALWWEKPHCLEQDLVLLLLLLYSTLCSKAWAECRAPCPNSAYTRWEQLLPHQLTSAQMRQKKPPETNEGGLEREGKPKELRLQGSQFNQIACSVSYILHCSKGTPKVVDNQYPGSLTHTATTHRATWKQKNYCKEKKWTF